MTMAAITPSNLGRLMIPPPSPPAARHWARSAAMREHRQQRPGPGTEGCRRLRAHAGSSIACAQRATEARGESRTARAEANEQRGHHLQASNQPARPSSTAHRINLGRAQPEHVASHHPQAGRLQLQAMMNKQQHDAEFAKLMMLGTSLTSRRPQGPMTIPAAT